MAKPTNSQIIAMLNDDLKGEHAAIIQYLRHAYALGEGDLAAEIEAIAREEMYHYMYLSDAIVELGGKPTVERGKLDLAGNEPPAWMERNVLAEQDAIDLYEKHLRVIEDPTIIRTLQRIVSDERSHKADFTKFVGKLKAAAAGESDLPPEAAPPPPNKRTVEILNSGVQHEYTVIVQYLYHSFTTPHRNIGEELHWQAVNEMQHMGWLSEEVAGLGVEPDMEYAGVDVSENTTDMLKADIAAERAVTMDYNAQIEELKDPKVKTLLARIRDHEIFHDQLFSDMLQELETDEPAAPPDASEGADAGSGPKIPTIGSLLGS